MGVMGCDLATQPKDMELSETHTQVLPSQGPLIPTMPQCRLAALQAQRGCLPFTPGEQRN